MANIDDDERGTLLLPPEAHWPCWDEALAPGAEGVGRGRKIICVSGCGLVTNYTRRYVVMSYTHCRIVKQSSTKILWITLISSPFKLNIHGRQWASIVDLN